MGTSAFNYDPNDPTVLPNLLIEVSRDLGDGSTAVCDDSPGAFGGVPAVDPPDFSATPFIAAAINDFACRFKNDLGNPGARTKSFNSCIVFPDGSFNFYDPTTRVQFCGMIDSTFDFGVGDTVVTVRVSDVGSPSHVSRSAQIVIRADM